MQVVDCGTPNEPHRLRQEGPALLVEVRHPRSIRDPDPETLTFLGLIDTGSSHCCVDRTIVQSLGLQYAGQAAFGGVEGNFTAGRYVAHLRFPQLNATYQMTVAAMQAMVDGIGRPVLLGRDFLQFCRLVYNGPTRDVTLKVRNRS